MKLLLKLYRMFYRLLRLKDYQRHAMLSRAKMVADMRHKYLRDAYDTIFNDYRSYKNLALEYGCNSASELEATIESLYKIKKPQKQSNTKEDNKMEMIETKHDLLTTKYTKVLEEADYKYNAPHTFKVIKAQEETSEEHKGENLVLSEIHFQEGPIKECGVNGVCNEDLLVMVVRRLEGFQNSEFKCRENACAITKIEEALLWLRKRTMGRENRGVEGTHTV